MKKLIVIDPGHGGGDDGAAWGEKFDYVEEDDLNLIVSFLLRYELLLTLRNFDVMLTREKDVFVPLIERAEKANNWGADIFVSIHADAFHKKTVSGISTHVFPRCSKRALDLSSKIQHSLVNKFPDHVNRGIKRSDFYVLHKTKMPAVLVEAEFLSNPKTRRFLKEPENQLDLAKAIALGIEECFKY